VRLLTKGIHLLRVIFGMHCMGEISPVFAIHSKLAVVIFALESYPKLLNLALLSQLTVDSG
jgi:hypothetical protein